MIKRVSANVLIPLIVFLLTMNVVRQQKSNPIATKEKNREEIPSQLRETDAYQALKWYNDQRAYPTGKIPEDWREKALKHINRHNLQKSH